MSDSPRVAELFGRSTLASADWRALIDSQECLFTAKPCFKTRKSDPGTSIGTCVVRFGRVPKPLVICPNRFLADNGQVFTDCLHLLSRHEPGNQLHLVPEVSVPGGSVDYFLVSAKADKPVDFVGIEFQALDTTGTVWPHRQEFLLSKQVIPGPAEEIKSMGINWKMTAKTTLLQLHHKTETLETLGRKLVLVLQQELMDYMTREFSFEHLSNANLGDSLHFHPYELERRGSDLELVLGGRQSTDADGIARALSLSRSAKLGLDEVLAKLRDKMGHETRWNPAST